MSWKTFLKAHWGAIAATDFFSVEVLTRVGLVRYFVLFVIDLQTRRIEIAGIAQQPDGEWMKQIARNLTDADSGFLNGTRYLIHDRAPLFTEGFRKLLKPSGVKTVKLPARSPDLNAYAERFALSVKSECLAKIIPLGERHLRKAVKDYTEHYHQERNYQGLDNELIEKLIDGPDHSREVTRRRSATRWEDPYLFAPGNRRQLPAPLHLPHALTIHLESKRSTERILISSNFATFLFALIPFGLPATETTVPIPRSSLRSRMTSSFVRSIRSIPNLSAT